MAARPTSRSARCGSRWRARPARARRSSTGRACAIRSARLARGGRSSSSTRRSMPAAKRLFIGARVSVQTANALAAAAETLQRRAKDAGVDIKWVAPVNYHATLKFLGFTREDAIGAVRDALEAALVGVQPLKFRTAR